MLSLYRTRRQMVLDSMESQTGALFVSPCPSIRNGDVEYSFRQSSNLIYLTGITAPETSLLLYKSKTKVFELLFIRERDVTHELWTGPRMTCEVATEISGVETVYTNNDRNEKLAASFSEIELLQYTSIDKEAIDIVLDSIKPLGCDVMPYPKDTHPVHQRRLYKDNYERKLLERAAEITVSTHTELMKHISPTMNEHEVHAQILYHFRKQGGDGEGYPSIVGGGNNATILHYTMNNALLKDRNLILVDAGCEYQGYTADVTRTFPVGGLFTPEQRALYEIVLDAQCKAIAATKPGVTLNDLHAICVDVIVEGLLEFELLEGSKRQIIADESYKKFYPHRTSHWLGLDVHDVGAPSDRNNQPVLLEPGMVFTIEPGIYIGDSMPNISEEYRNIGIRIEDDIFVTENGCDVLTEQLAKTVDDVETLCCEGNNL